MLTITEIPADLESFYSNYIEKCKKLFNLFPLKEQIKFPSGSSLFAKTVSDGIFYLADGYCKLYQDNKIIRLYNSGEFLVISQDFSGFNTVCDFAVKGFFWQTDEFIQLLKDQDLLKDWLKIRELENCINLNLAGVYLGEDVKLDFKHQVFKKGDLIIKKGDVPEMIYELISGEAIVMAAGKIVGRIYEEEIFGEISFLTESMRSADVIAVEDCNVRMIDMATFERLIALKPRMILQISKTLANRIVQLNDRLVSI
jgi:CRP-like cAMP-binding protein